MWELKNSEVVCPAAVCQKMKQCDGLFEDTSAGHRAWRKLPDCRPHGFFFARLGAGMKTGFILITHGNLNFNGVPQLGEDSGGREARIFHRQPRLGFHNDLFV